MRATISGAFLLFFLATWVPRVSVSAQQFPAPPGWKWVTDAEARIVTTLDLPAGAWLFGTMAPGWHITTRPAVTLFEPSYTARGRFAIESEAFLFPREPGRIRVFVGGQELEGRGRYGGVLIRRDGSAAVESMEAGRAGAVYAWTKTAAVVPGSGSGDPARNVLRVEAEAAEVTFLVNGQKVTAVPREGAMFDGVVGLRIGSDLNLHVMQLGSHTAPRAAAGETAVDRKNEEGGGTLTTRSSFPTAGARAPSIVAAR